MKNIDCEIDRICEFIRDNVSKTKSDGVIIALSGGLDSAIVAALSTKAIGKENVHCYFLRYNFGKSDIDKLHTEALCNKFGLTYEENQVVSQSSKTSFFNRMIQRVTDTLNTFLVNIDYLHMILGNIDAKMRTGYLSKKAHEQNCLLLGTTNHSEQLIGYFTTFDEYDCDLQPILHLYKTEIVEMAKHLGIPNEIINRTPSADLWYGHINEKGLTYQKLDKILIELDKTNIDTLDCEIDDATKEEVFRMMTKAKQKYAGSFPPCLEKFNVFNEVLYER